MASQGKRASANKTDRTSWRRGIRKGFDQRNAPICQGCFEKNCEIDQLRDQIRILKKRLINRERAVKTKGVFGHSTPSSQIPIKESTAEDNRKKKGGAKLGHVGAGREAFDPEHSQEPVREISMPESCPECEVRLHAQGKSDRTLVDVTPSGAKRVLYHCNRGRCPRCFRTYTKKPQALPKTLYGNELVAQAATMHYAHGIPIGRILEVLGPEVTEGGLIQAFHRLGKLCEPAVKILTEQYREASVKHADETGWRTDGERGYSWVFCSEGTTLFKFQESRSASVAQKILGHVSNPKRLPGVLVVDRYGGYNQVNCEIQYCFAHLLREAEKLADTFTDNTEAVEFSERMSAAIAKAIRLRKEVTDNEEYKKQAVQVQSLIQQLARAPAKHMGVKDLQRIFTEKEHRLFHWVRDRSIPADNNRAEREIRPTVVARKTSFGSQSSRGAKTRSHIMSVLYSVKKRLRDKAVDRWLKESLDEIALSPQKDFSDLLPQIPSPSTPGN